MADNMEAGSSSSKPAEDESAVSMLDILEEQQALEEDANAVLGDADDQNCTYTLGYLPRQALYACQTCTTVVDEPTGICLACSYACHEGHDLIELYTKRNFRCDCGNSKFGSHRCNLAPDKDALNDNNNYNQNFRGVYCTCKRPYPDPEDDVEDEMIQCVACEDWYHGRHLREDGPPEGEWDEVVCSACMTRLPFLAAYYFDSTATSVEKGDTAESVDVSTSPKKAESSSPKRPSPRKSPVKNGGGSPKKGSPSTSLANGDGSPGRSAECQYKLLSARKPTVTVKSAFWTKGWRSKLCACKTCQAMYDELKVAFLTDEDDTVHAYEERGRSKRQGVGSHYEQGLGALQNMNRIQQVELIQGFNDMKEGMKEYFKKFADNGKVVREEDVREFFAGLAARKRQRTAVQYNCK